MPSPALAVAHVLAATWNEAAGPVYSVPALCRELAAAGHRVSLLTVDGRFARDRDGYRHESFAADLGCIPLVRTLAASRGLRRAMGEPRDILHTHGLWLMPNLYGKAGARRAGARHVVSPRGTLSPGALAFSRPKKRLVGALWQDAVLARTDMIHATAESELDDVRRYGLRAPVAVVPNGIDLPTPAPCNRTGPERTVLSLGRIHPKKGLDRLVRAFAGLEAEFPRWSLRIVGPDEAGHAGELAALAASLGARRIRIQGPAYGEAKRRALADADVFALPTMSENFAMTVAESLAAGTPVVATRGAPWPGLETERCGLWVDHGPEPLAAALASLMRLPDGERAAMGARGRAWMARDFSWDALARELASAYAWLLGRGDRPASIRTEA